MRPRTEQSVIQSWMFSIPKEYQYIDGIYGPVMFDEVFKKMEEQGLDPVLFGLSDEDYQLIAKNFAQIRNQLKITNDILDKYKEYYEGENDGETR